MKSFKVSITDYDLLSFIKTILANIDTSIKVSHFEFSYQNPPSGKHRFFVQIFAQQNAWIINKENKYAEREKCELPQFSIAIPNKAILEFFKNHVSALNYDLEVSSCHCIATNFPNSTSSINIGMRLALNLIKEEKTMNGNVFNLIDDIDDTTLNPIDKRQLIAFIREERIVAEKVPFREIFSGVIMSTNETLIKKGGKDKQ